MGVNAFEVPLALGYQLGYALHYVGRHPWSICEELLVTLGSNSGVWEWLPEVGAEAERLPLSYLGLRESSMMSSEWLGGKQHSTQEILASVPRVVCRKPR